MSYPFQPEMQQTKTSRVPLLFCLGSYAFYLFLFKKVSLAHSHVKTVQWHPLQGWFAATSVFRTQLSPGSSVEALATSASYHGAPPVINGL